MAFQNAHNGIGVALIRQFYCIIEDVRHFIRCPLAVVMESRAGLYPCSEPVSHGAFSITPAVMQTCNFARAVIARQQRHGNELRPLSCVGLCIAAPAIYHGGGTNRVMPPRSPEPSAMWCYQYRHRKKSAGAEDLTHGVREPAHAAITGNTLGAPPAVIMQRKVHIGHLISRVDFFSAHNPNRSLPVEDRLFLTRASISGVVN